MSTSIGNPPQPRDAYDRRTGASEDAEKDFAEAAHIDGTADADKHSTTRTTEGHGPRPRLPHEHDESSDSQRQESRPIIERAHADLEAGRVDTDRGPPMDAAYKKQKAPAGPKYR